MMLDMASNPLIRLAEFIKERRQELGYTQEGLARVSKVPKGTIGSIEAGNLKGPPTLPTLEKLEAALRLNQGMLISVLREDWHPYLLGGQSESAAPAERPMLEVIEGFNKRYEPTEEEWAIIRELEAQGIWYSEFTQPGFWEATPEEREGSFLHIKGLLREHRRRTQGK